jgi:hypothetical protein
MLLAIDLPSNLSYGALNLVRIFEDHKSFSVNLFTHIFGFLTCEVLLEQVNLIVLLNATFSCSSQILCRRCETKG